MMRLPPFRYMAPRTIQDAAKMIRDAGPEGMLVAGGTDLYPNMKRRQFEPKVLIGLRGLGELRAMAGGPLVGLCVGAGATLHEVSEHPVVRRGYPALAAAAGQVATPQIQRMGTIGGNLCVDTRCNYYNQSYAWREAIGFCMKKDGDICLVAPGSPRCWAVSSSDTAPVMIALGATVRLVGPDGERAIPAGALYRDDGIDYLTKRPDEILTAIDLPPIDGWKSIYLKLRRRGSFDFPILGVAVALRRAGDGTCTDARIVLGAVHSYPVEATEAAQMLVGRRPDPDLIAGVALAAYGPAKPLDNTDLTLSYRKRMARVFVSRAIRHLCGLPTGELPPA